MSYEKVYAMSFSKIYHALVQKALRKNRTQDEVDEIIMWLTGYKREDIINAEVDQITYGDFFRNAPSMNKDRHLINGSICGIKLSDIEDPLMKDMRYLDKMIDELAKGKSLEKVLRKNLKINA